MTGPQPEAVRGDDPAHGPADETEVERREDDLSHLYKLCHGGDLPFCGCGDPESVYDLIRDLLALAPFYEHRSEVRELIGNAGEGPYYLTLYVLDNAGLTEHGISIDGSWLTAKGKHYLALMQRYTYDDLDETGFPHDGKDCPPECRHRQASE